MRILILPYILLTIFAITLAAFGTIFWSLDADGFAAFEARFDVSDAILTAVILILLALLPLREKN